MMKKIVVLLTAIGALSAVAQDITMSGNKFVVEDKLTKSCKVKNLDVKNITKSGVLTIPSSITHDGVVYNVTTIARGAVKSSEYIDRIEIPSTVTRIESGAFDLSEAPGEIYVYSSTPPELEEGAFPFETYSSSCLHIPVASKANYATLSGWYVYGCTQDDLFNDELNDYVTNVKAHVFMSPGDEKVVTDYFEDLTEGDVKTWVIGDNNIIDFVNDNSSSLVKAKDNFGETYMLGCDAKGNKLLHIMVYVCPTVKVKSPLGAVYRYHKIYNSPAKIYLSQGENWLINCVMFNDEDVTSMVEKEDTDKDGKTDGQFYSMNHITSDATFTISVEENTDGFNGSENGEVVGTSGLNLQVIGQRFFIVDSQTKEKACVGKNVKIKDLRGKEIYNQAWPEKGFIYFNNSNKGVFTVKIEGYAGEFRIIIA